MAIVNSRSLLDRLKRVTKLYWLKVLRIRSEPEVVARGVACGVFAGWLPAIPVLPVQIIMAMLLSFVFRGSKIAAFTATWISNPFNWVIFYIIEYKVGSFFSPFGDLNLNISFDNLQEAATQLAAVSWKGLVVMYIGGALLGLPSAFASYFIALPLIRNYRRRRTLRMLEKKTRV